MTPFIIKEAHWMSKWEKPIRKLMSISDDLTFEELRKILLSLGYEETQPHGGSSHYTFRKEMRKVTIPRHKPIGRIYIEMVRKLVKEENDEGS